LLKIDVWKEKVLLYKDLVSDPGNGIQATSSTWAKKHIFGWSDEEVRLDLQQQRIERAVGEELKATPTVITKTGLFDNIDKLYGNSSGGTATTASTETSEPTPSFGGGGGGEFETADLGGGEELPPAGEETVPPAGGEAEITPESRMGNLNMLVENNLIEGARMINLGHGQDSLGEISKELDKLLNS
jgi:hypothetical protein